MKVLHMVAYILVWAGALNWGLVGLFDFNLVAFLVGSWPVVENLVYIAVGIAAIYTMATHIGECKVCKKK